MTRRFGSALALLCTVLAPAARGQSIEVQLREELNRTPVAGAIVRLLSDTKVLQQGLTDALGRITLTAPAAGSYRIKADRIGYIGVIVGPIELAPGPTDHREILMPSTRRELPTVEVRGSNQCRTSDSSGTTAAALWEEINKALTANLLTARQGSIPLLLRKFVREADRSGTVVRQWVYSSSVVRGQPFASLPPAALAQRGFIEEDGDSVTYAAPDAALLISDEFVSTHCFRAQPGNESIVGLAFEPIPGRKVKDVRGTLWVDRGTSELQFLEYKYTGTTGDQAKSDLGGRVEFRRLPDGAWIVSYWHIRMRNLSTSLPPTSGDSHGQIVRRIGYIDRGGRTEPATDATGQVDRAMVMGRVFDSTTGRGLPGAVLRVQGYLDSAVTGGDGRYQLAVRGSGDQVVMAGHPKLGLAGGDTEKGALLSLGDTTVVGFAVPSLATFARSFCGGRASRPGLVGVASGDHGPARGLTVRVMWIKEDGGVRDVRSESLDRGLFVVCDLPPGRTLTVRLQDGIRPLAERRVELVEGQFRWLDLMP